jgi:ACS family pantothenate transporter-like MFS transporter
MPHEIALRMSLYNIAQPAGAMVSGAMQGALSTNFEGLHGRSGWRWAFIINVRFLHQVSRHSIRD